MISRALVLRLVGSGLLALAAAGALDASTTIPSRGASDLIRVSRLDLPVAWQMTRARLASGAGMLTTSFREVWTIERRPDGFVFLQSPRAKVEVTVTDASETAMPESVMIAERDFARLVGIKPHAAEAPEGDASRMMSLSLERAARHGTDVVIAVGDDEHYDVHLAVGTSIR